LRARRALPNLGKAEILNEIMLIWNAADPRKVAGRGRLGRTPRSV